MDLEIVEAGLAVDHMQISRWIEVLREWQQWCQFAKSVEVGAEGLEEVGEVCGLDGLPGERIHVRKLRLAGDLARLEVDHELFEVILASGLLYLLHNLAIAHLYVGALDREEQQVLFEIDVLPFLRLKQILVQHVLPLVRVEGIVRVLIVIIVIVLFILVLILANVIVLAAVFRIRSIVFCWLLLLFALLLPG